MILNETGMCRIVEKPQKVSTTPLSGTFTVSLTKRKRTLDQAQEVLQAATKLDREEPADNEVAVAKYWASYGGSRVGHAGLHVHGGISIDVDYPIHRYFLWSKQIEFTLGGGNQHLAAIGRRLADQPA